MAKLEDNRAARWRDDYGMSRRLRRAHRESRHSSLLTAAADFAKGVRLPLELETPEDSVSAANVNFAAERRLAHARRSEKRMRLLNGSIFPDAGAGNDERLRALQTRRERGMKIVCTPKC